MTFLALTGQPAWLAVIIGVVIAVIAAAIIGGAKFGIKANSVHIWAFCTWCRVTFPWRFSTLYRRRRVVLASLIDYVRLLEALRSHIVDFCRDTNWKDSGTDKPPRPTILIHVFTRQLPRDWPVWHSGVGHDTPNKTPLEQYAYNLHDFIAKKGNNNHKVQIRRVVVIDSCKSPDGVDRLVKLKADLIPGNARAIKSLDDYFQLLHTGKEKDGGSHDAFYYEYERPWPGWLADIVFYGIRQPNDTLEWLWAVTSSYDAEEDLALLRLHPRLGDRLESDDWPLPGDYKSLKQLAELAGDLTKEHMHYLIDIRKWDPDKSTKSVDS